MTTEPLPPLRQLPVWRALEDHARRLQDHRSLALFEHDPQRLARFVQRAGALHADFSKQRIDGAALDDLLALAEVRNLRAGIDALFGAATVNFTEQRAALHMAMRGSCAVPAADAAIADTTRVRAFAAALRAGHIVGARGEPIRHVVNLGIGGSDLGPRLACEALARHADSPVRVDFVANVDPRELDTVLAEADPATTLFVVSSKSFGTAETLANAAAARDWLRARLGTEAELGAHFAAVSNAVDAAQRFGIAAERVFPLPEWVGGRYSVWSAIGLPLMVALGDERFDAFLAGGRAMDAHFRDTPFAANLPVLAGLIGLWNTDFLGIETLGVLPYAHGLRNFPGWLQQLEMESNGKRVRRDGSAVGVPTSPIVWGGVGTVGQHAFHQLFYQGTRRVALDFIVPVGGGDARQRALVDNALAQSAALMAGRDTDTARAALRARGLTEDEVERLAPHLASPGDQPSTTLLLSRLDAFELGQLLALYEHKIFVQGWIWGINSFDQYGVELGKDMARALAAGTGAEPDPSTAALMAAAEAMRTG